MGQLVATGSHVAVLEQSTSSDLLGVGGGDQTIVQVTQSLLEVSTHGQNLYIREEILSDSIGRVHKDHGAVQHDMEGIGGELVLSPHAGDELQIDVASFVVVEGDERPSVPFLREDLHHLLDVGNFQVTGDNPVFGRLPWHEVDQGRQYGLLDGVKGFLRVYLDVEYQVQVLVDYRGTVFRF